jgi:hypothetical protein
MNRSRISIIFVVATACLVITAPIASAHGGANPGVLPPTSRIQGLTYGDWSARWWQYVFSIPTPQNPLTSGTGAATQRVDNVELVVANSTMDEPIELQVPAGTMLYLELLVVECSTLEPDPFYGGNEQELRACAHNFVPTDMEAAIDGVEIRNPSQYISTSPLYEFGVPEDNILGVADGTTGESVSYGAFLLLAPLSPGKHTIHTHAAYPDLDYTADRTLDLTVTR